MAVPFPSFGKDMDDRYCLYVGELHDNPENVALLVWKMMWLHDLIDAVFIEYYPIGVSPVQGRIKEELAEHRFLGHRRSMHLDVAALRHQCLRWGVRLEGWNDPGGLFERAMQSWNDQAALGLVARLRALGNVRSYVVLGGLVHGPKLAKSPCFQSLPCFTRDGDDFRQYTGIGGEWAPQSVTMLSAHTG